MERLEIAQINEYNVKQNHFGRRSDDEIHYDNLSGDTTFYIHPGFLHRNEGRNDELTANEQVILHMNGNDPTHSATRRAAKLGLSKTNVERKIK